MASNCNITTLIANAQPFANLSPGMWDAIELQLLCEIYNAVGGLNAFPPDYIPYSGPPTVAPPGLQNIVVDVNGRQWQYYNGGWS